MSNDSEFDPVAYWDSRPVTEPLNDTIRALAAESARRQAMKDAGICREQDVLMRPYGCAQAIELEAGL